MSIGKKFKKAIMIIVKGAQISYVTTKIKKKQLIYVCGLTGNIRIIRRKAGRLMVIG